MINDVWEIVAARVVLELSSPQELSDLATSELDGGYDTPTVRELALEGIRPTNNSFGLFKRALEEKGLAIPSKAQAVQKLAASCADEILKGKCTPVEGGRRIWDLSLLADQRLPELDPFIYAVSEVEDRPEDRAFFESAILDAARDLSRAQSTDQ